jgi:hypothetical protein
MTENQNCQIIKMDRTAADKLSERTEQDDPSHGSIL